MYGGTQDNATQGGPSRTNNVNGIRNSDWFTTVFGDGFDPAVYHHPGALMIVGIFSRQPIETKRVERVVFSARQEGSDDASIDWKQIDAQAAVYTMSFTVGEE